MVEPDLLYISSSRLKRVVKDWVRGAPDLVIEILSESTEEIDRTLKFKQYEKFGMREYWIVDPDAETVEVFVRREEGYQSLAKVGASETIKSEVLRGLDFQVAAAFAV